MIIKKVNVFSAILTLLCFCECLTYNNCKEKRSVYRSQVVPALGGKIPESAFHPHTLNSNLLSRNGIFSRDGVHFQQQYFKNTHANNDRISPPTLKLHYKVAKPGRHFGMDTVDTTYVIREPVNDFPVPSLHRKMDEFPVVPLHSLRLKEMYQLINRKSNFQEAESEQILKEYTPLLRAMLDSEHYK